MTIKEVAQLAGVSAAAVSRYLNGGPLSQEKKEKIAWAIEETGYRPNLMAKTMRTGKVRQVGIIVPRIFSESVNQMMDGIAEELLEKGYLTVLGYSDPRKDRELQYFDMMQSNRVAGIILMGTAFSDYKKSALAGSTVPLVVTGQCIDELPCVYHDDFNGVRELTGLLLRKGRRKLVYIGVFEEDKAAGLARRQGGERLQMHDGTPGGTSGSGRRGLCDGYHRTRRYGGAQGQRTPDPRGREYCRRRRQLGGYGLDSQTDHSAPSPAQMRIRSGQNAAADDR